MDSAVRERVSDSQEPAKKSFLTRLKILASLLNSLVGLMILTEEEREAAGIYHGRPGPGGE